MPDTREWLLMLHILSVVVAFSPAVAHTSLLRLGEADGPDVLKRLFGYMARNDRMIYSPALILVGVFGFLLVADQDHIGFDEPWISAAMLLWFIMNGVLHGMMIPAERKVAAGDDSAQKMVMIAGPVIGLLFLITLYLMVVKPGM